MDWMTLAITATGAVIFCIWVVIPIGEYRTIFRRLREERMQHDHPEAPPKASSKASHEETTV